MNASSDERDFAWRLPVPRRKADGRGSAPGQRTPESCGNCMKFEAHLA
jgi:hypothetical protein